MRQLRSSGSVGGVVRPAGRAALSRKQLDIAKEEFGDLSLNTQDSPKPKNRLDPEEFFKQHPLQNPHPDPLTIIQENEIQEARKKLGLEN